MTTEGFKVLRAELENFKNIKHFVLTLNGESAYILGGNGKGKSTLIDALLSPIDSSFIPAMPITADAEDQRGIIRLSVGNPEVVYDINVVFTKANRTGKVSLFCNGEEVKGSVKTKIKQIFGEISFDIYEFMKMPVAEKIKVLKKLTGCEEQLEQLEEKRKERSEHRLHLDKTINEMKAVNDKKYRPFTPEEITQYAAPIDEAAIQSELDNLKPAIEKWNKVNQGAKDFEAAAKKNEQDIQSVQFRQAATVKEIADLYARIETLKKQEQELKEQETAMEAARLDSINKRDKCLSWLENNSFPDTASISDRLANAREHNRMVSIVAEYRERHKNLQYKIEEREKVDVNIKEIDQYKIDLIGQSQLPVKGLYFDDKQVYLDGIPLEQVNTQKILDVAAEISMAVNSNLKLVTIREASLFDKQHLNDLIKRLDARGYQWIAEVVDEEGGELEVIFAEEEL